MTAEQSLVFGVLAALLALFIWGRWRYDLVAMAGLLTLVFLGVVPGAEAFSGFGHPAVITVAAVLVLSRGLLNAGVVDVLAGLIERLGTNPTVQVATLTGLTAACSAFMNNVGALALLMPVAIWIARKSGRSPSLLLMPMAFGSLLGGMITLIGTPPNIIVASFREQAGLAPFGMFDYAPIGLGITATGVAFIALVGWRFLPERQGQAAPEELFQIDAYLTEVRVPEESPLAGQTLRYFETEIAKDSDAAVLAVIRNDRRMLAPARHEVVRAGDILLVESDPEALKKIIDAAKLTLAESKEGAKLKLGKGDTELAEVVVAADSRMLGRTAAELDLRQRHGMNLLAVARQGQRLRQRLSKVRFEPGDILLVQGEKQKLQATVRPLGCLWLAGRGLRLDKPRRLLLATVIFAAGLSLAAANLLPVPVALTAAALAMVLAGLVPTSELYTSIDWPIIILLAAMMPVGRSLETTGGAQLIAEQMLHLGRSLPPAASVAALLIVTMLLSDVVNNAAAAVLMAPIGIALARGLDLSVDPFLLAVAVGASCAFLTPIGHQSNTLVMVPGGYKFGDYWRMGLPLSCVVALTAIPLILWYRPL